MALSRCRGWRGEGVKEWRGEGVKGWRSEGVKGWRGEGIKRWRDEGVKGWRGLSVVASLTIIRWRRLTYCCLGVVVLLSALRRLPLLPSVSPSDLSYTPTTPRFWRPINARLRFSFLFCSPIWGKDTHPPPLFFFFSKILIVEQKCIYIFYILKPLSLLYMFVAVAAMKLTKHVLVPYICNEGNYERKKYQNSSIFPLPSLSPQHSTPSLLPLSILDFPNPSLRHARPHDSPPIN